MTNNAVSHIQQQYAAHHPQCNTFALDKPKSAAYGYASVFFAFNNADGTPTNAVYGFLTILQKLLRRRTGQPAHLPPHHGHQLRRIE